MNSPTINQSNTDPMQKYVDAVIGQQPESSQSESAQRKLLARLDARTSEAKSMNGGWGWATAAAAAVLLPMLLWMPGTNSALAFSDVQRHFLAFDTLVAQLTTTVGGNELVETTIRVDDRDRTRLDAGAGFTYVIDPTRSMMLQLFHDQKRALLMPLAGPAELDDGVGLDWLADIREFQGQAELLDETMVIRGRQAYGFSLDAGGMDMTLWAAESGEPLSLLMAGPGGLETRLDFEFDRPLDDALFALTPPADYRLLGESATDDARN